MSQLDPVPGLPRGATCEHIFYEEQRDNWSIFSRSGRAVAHDEERRAFKRLGKESSKGLLFCCLLACLNPRYRTSPGVIEPVCVSPPVC